MEYLISCNEDMEVLKVKGDHHTDLTGFQEITQEYPDQTITDRFHIIRKLDSKEDEEENCYDWYEIDRHYRVIDKTGPVKDQGAKNTAHIDYLSMMTGVELPEEKEAIEYE